MDLVNDINLKTLTWQNCTDPNYCYNPSIWCDGIVLGGAIVNLIIWVVVCLVYLTKYARKDTAMRYFKSENVTLQAKITEKKIEIANLNRQLINRRNDRRPARVVNPLPLPLRTEQENERGHLLTVNRIPDYQAVQ